MLSGVDINVLPVTIRLVSSPKTQRRNQKQFFRQQRATGCVAETFGKSIFGSGIKSACAFTEL